MNLERNDQYVAKTKTKTFIFNSKGSTRMGLTI